MAEISSFDYSKRNIEDIPFEKISNKINWLIVSDNKIKKIPDDIQNLKYLTRLAANDNRISDISSSISKLQNLNWIDLTRNRLRSLPESFHNLQKVTGLGLSENEFDNIPECIFKMVNLRKFGFFSNRIKKLSPDICLLKNLVKIDLSNNQLSSLPDEFCELTYLNWLNLSNNKLKRLPEKMNNLIHLEELGLGMNQLSELPNLENLHKLRILPVFKNRIRKINETIKQLKSIEKLDFSDNEISEFPYELLEVGTLRYLNLKSNKIKSIRTEYLEDMKCNINMIDISDNLLSYIPLKFFKAFSNITTIRINDNPYVFHKNKTPEIPSLLEVCYSKSLNLHNNSAPWISSMFKKIQICDSCGGYFVGDPYIVYCLSNVNDGLTFVVEKTVCSGKCFKHELK